MNQKHLLLAAALALCTGVVLVACGGGSSGTSSGSAMPASASGVLSAFGSIFVNGMEYATGASTNVVDGDDDDAPSMAAALRVGMTVDVDWNGQAAGLVRFRSAARGEVDAVPGDGTITVLGQLVQTTGATSFAGSDAGGAITNASGGGVAGSVQVGDFVTVYGYIECTNTACTKTQVVASLVYASTTPGPYRTEGYAQVANGATDTFTINGLTVDYATTGASPTVCSPSPCSITNGAFVAVRSSTAPSTVAANTPSLTLTATNIRTSSQLPVYAPGATVSVEGPVRQLTGSVSTGETFNLRGASIIVSSTVAATVPSLANNQIVQVTGTVNPDGTIAATAVSIERHATLAVMAPMDSDSTITTPETITLLGQTFVVNGSTRFVDWDQDVRPFNLGNFASVLHAGDQLIVSGYTTSTGDVATRVERIRTPATPIAGVEGIVTADSPSATSGTLTIGGVVATLGTSTTLRYPGAAGSPTLAGFFSAVTANTTVAGVLGTEASGTPGALTAIDAVALRNTCQWATDPR